MSPVTVVDCTLRDGGFHNHWDFEPELVSAYLRAVDEAGVDWAEVGYRSLERGGFHGALRYSDDEVLAALPALAHTRLAVMLDARELATREALVERLFRPADQSRVGLVRIATGPRHLASALDVASRLAHLGYRTGLNLMAWPAVPEAERAAILARVIDHPALDVVYLADSYGTLYPSEVAGLGLAVAHAQAAAAMIKPWGVHLHDSLELAFANALAAREAGASWIDGSVLGMGRGAGNLKTELWLQHLESRGSPSGAERRYRAGPIYELVGRWMQPLQARYRWGSSPPYALSGQLGMHPMYAQELLESHRYSLSEVTAILHALHAAGLGRAFSRAALDEAISTRPASPDAPRAPTARPADLDHPLSTWRGPDWSDREVLVVGRGPSTRAHAAAIDRWIRAFRPIVIECNHLPELAASPDHLAAFTLAANAKALGPAALAAGKAVLLGSAGGPVATFGDLAGPVFVEPYRVQSGHLEPGSAIIPADVVSMFAIAQAVRFGARAVTLVGFDGYDHAERLATSRERRMQEELVAFFELLGQRAPMVKVLSLTPTSFPVPVRSIYGALALHGVEP